MVFRTIVPISNPGYFLSHTDHILLLGSCFAENIGEKIQQNKFRACINPFGILYNPASVAQAIRRLLDPISFGKEELFRSEGVFHSFAHHSRFSDTDKEKCLDKINQALTDSSLFLQQTNRLIITFGTSWIYRLKENGEVVSNCHKLPEKLFSRERLSIEEIVKEWESLISTLIHRNNDCKILFTVSPVRHWKDGAHANQLSKSILLLAIEKICRLFPGQVTYFPAYEIVMDELRDYRFYGEDMLHPSSQAVEYIWQRFSECFFSKETTDLLKNWEGIRKAINHKPFQPESESYQRFIMQTLLKAEQIKEIFPSFEIEKEIQELKTKIS